jgi:hypothetical protein
MLSGTKKTYLLILFSFKKQGIENVYRERARAREREREIERERSVSDSC